MAGYAGASLSRDLTEARAILEKYDISAEGIAAASGRYENFQVTVPFIGAFNTGKSSAINALLDMNLLPTGITANTTVPTEIVYGANSMEVFRNGSSQPAGIHELRDRTLDLDGVSFIHLELEHPFLKSVQSVRMVDMPGLDSGISEHERAIREYLPNSLAYILTFSADEPVVKKSVAQFLSELRLREMPVYLVLSKCDKVPQETVERAVTYLKETVEKLLGIGADVYCVRAKAGRDVTALSGLLMRLQEQADGIRDRMCAQSLLESVRPAQAYIKQRLAGEQMPASELEGRIEQLQRQAERVSAAVERENRRFAEDTGRALAAVRSQIFTNLRDSKSAMLSSMLAGAPVWPQTDRMLMGVLAAGIPSEFTTALVRHLRSLSAILAADFSQEGARSAAAAKVDELLGAYAYVAQDGGSKPESEPEPRRTLTPENHLPQHEGHRLVGTERAPERQRAEKPPRPQGLDPAAKAVLDRFLGTRQIFDGMPMIPVQATRAAKEKAAQKAIIEHVLPQLLSMTESCAETGINASVSNIHDSIEKAIESDYAMKQHALEDIRREKQREDSKREARLIELETDLNMLGIITRGADSLLRGGEEVGVL